MALKRGHSNVGVQRSIVNGSWLPLAVLVFFCVILPFLFFFGPGILLGANGNSDGLGKENIDWRERMAAQHLKSLISKEVIDVIAAATDDSNPFNIDTFRKSNLSASWRIVGPDSLTENNSILDTSQSHGDNKQELPRSRSTVSSDDHSNFVDNPAKLIRRQLREKRREKRVADLVRHDDEATIKLENAAIERSKSVDSAVLGKYSIWRRDIENENADTTVRFMRDQMIMARVYLTLARMKSKLNLFQELQTRLKESQRALGEATADTDLPHSAQEKMKDMGQALSKARDELYDCKLVTGKLRAMLQTADEQVRSLKRQSTFLSQLAAKTIPNGIHCMSMHLTIDYYLLPPEKRKFPKSENLENRDLYHYALFSDNVLAASVVVNSTIMNAKVIMHHLSSLQTYY
ncbi:hypothetical protein SAY86_012525 [Trapa natans]|uniref:Uncharacterized protein n=1 Tax=Trapa natans TaxID=22666 RepID=A0AAN7LWU4_TRANT|nr:hypothetical protein SAY86_012525 [Trapa natans]